MDLQFCLVAPKPHRAPEPASKSLPNSRLTSPNKGKAPVPIKANHSLQLQGLGRNYPHANDFTSPQPMQRSTPMSIQVNGGGGVLATPSSYTKSSRGAGSFSAGHSPTLSPTMSPLSSSPSSFAFNSNSPRLKERNSSKLIFAQGVPHFAREHTPSHITLGIGMGMTLAAGNPRRDSLDEHELATREIQHIMTTTSMPISIPPGGHGRASISAALAAQAAASKQLQMHPQNNYSVHTLPHTGLQLPMSAASHAHVHGHAHALAHAHAGRHSPQTHAYHGYAHALSTLPQPMLHQHHYYSATAGVVAVPQSPGSHSTSLNCSPALAAMSPPVRSHNPHINDDRFHLPDEFDIERRDDVTALAQGLSIDDESGEMEGDGVVGLEAESFDPDSFDHFDQFDPVSVSITAEMGAEPETSSHPALAC